MNNLTCRTLCCKKAGHGFRCLAALLIVFLNCYPLQAKITRVIVTKTEPYLDGKVFGQTGSYEKLTGQAYGEVDPGNPLNSMIQDIQLAPRNEAGMVEYVSDFIILKPSDISKSNGLLFLSLPNRGNAFPADSVLLVRGYPFRSGMVHMKNMLRLSERRLKNW